MTARASDCLSRDGDRPRVTHFTAMSGGSIPGELGGLGLIDTTCGASTSTSRRSRCWSRQYAAAAVFPPQGTLRYRLFRMPDGVRGGARTPRFTASRGERIYIRTFVMGVPPRFQHTLGDIYAPHRAAVLLKNNGDGTSPMDDRGRVANPVRGCSSALSTRPRRLARSVVRNSVTTASSATSMLSVTASRSPARRRVSGAGDVSTAIGGPFGGGGAT